METKLTGPHKPLRDKPASTSVKLSATQAKVLETLRAIKAHAEATEAEADRGALGGLSAREKLMRKGSACSGEYVASAACGHGPWSSVAGATCRTYHSLRDKGLIYCAEGIWIAI